MGLGQSPEFTTWWCSFTSTTFSTIYTYYWVRWSIDFTQFAATSLWLIRSWMLHAACFLAELHRFWFVGATFLRTQNLVGFLAVAQVLGKRQVSEVILWVFDGPTKYDMIPCRWIGWKVWKQTNGKIILHVCCPKSVSKSDIDLKHVFFPDLASEKQYSSKAKPRGKRERQSRWSCKGWLGVWKTNSKFIDWKEKMCLKYLKDG